MMMNGHTGLDYSSKNFSLSDDSDDLSDEGFDHGLRQHKSDYQLDQEILDALQALEPEHTDLFENEILIQSAR